MALRTLATVALLSAFAVPADAQTPSADERAIRDLIAIYDTKGDNAVARTDDAVYWTGPFKRPAVGSEIRDPLPPEQQPGAPQAPGAPDRVRGSRRRVTTPVRIEIATSGDLAYEYSNSAVVFDLVNGQREEASPASVLRVWKKEAGQWKIAALFARPHVK